MHEKNIAKRSIFSFFQSIFNWFEVENLVSWHLRPPLLLVNMNMKRGWKVLTGSCSQPTEIGAKTSYVSPKPPPNLKPSICTTCKHVLLTWEVGNKKTRIIHTLPLTTSLQSRNTVYPSNRSGYLLSLHMLDVKCTTLSHVKVWKDIIDSQAWCTPKTT
jgi:hypothetical protein